MRRRIGCLQVPGPALEVVSKLEILPSVRPLDERETRLRNELKENSTRGEHEMRAGRQTGILSWAGEIKPWKKAQGESHVLGPSLKGPPSVPALGIGLGQTKTSLI